jgi:hypothetical protein
MPGAAWAQFTPAKTGVTTLLKRRKTGQFRLGGGARLPNNLNHQTKTWIWLNRACATPTGAPSRSRRLPCSLIVGTSERSVESRSPESGSRWDTARRVGRRSTLSILPSQALRSAFQVIREPRPTKSVRPHRRFAPFASYAVQMLRRGPSGPNTGSLSGMGREAMLRSACGRSPGLPLKRSQSRPSGYAPTTPKSPLEPRFL